MNVENKYTPWYPVNRSDRPYDEKKDNGATKFEKVFLEILKSLIEKEPTFDIGNMEALVQKAKVTADSMFNAMEQK